MVRVARLVVVLLSVAVLTTIIHGAGDSPVAKAVKAGDLAAVRKLATARADVNTPSGDGSTPLLWAVHRSDVEMTRVLIAAGAKPDVANHYGVTPLLDASRTGDAEMMELLLKAGADPKRTHLEGETPLMAASRSGSLPAVRLLLDRGVDVNATDSFQKETALMRESTTDQFAFDGSRLRPSHPNKATALDLVKTLMDRGADPHKVFAGQFHSTSMPNGDRFNNSPFFRAAVAADVETLKVMIAHGI